MADPFDGVRRVMFAHAHPDDETLATGSLIVVLVRRGIEVSVLSATRGERGEVVPGPLSYLADTPELEKYRAQELVGALEALSVSRHYYLGTPPASDGPTRAYRDSGMQWVRDGVAGPADDIDDESFVRAPEERAARDLVAALRADQTDVLVSYDAHGGYNHPDHVKMHQVALRATALAHVPMLEVVSDESHAGTDVTWYDEPDTMPTVFTALGHHATQVSVAEPYVIHSGGQRQLMNSRIGVRRVVNPEDIA